MKKNRKGLVVLGLLALCVILTAGVFMLGQSPKGEDILLNTDGEGGEVTPGGIDGNPVNPTAPGVSAPQVNPSGIIPPDLTDTGQSGSDIPLTVIEDRPDPPELPGTAPQDTEMDRETWDNLDPALKDPDKVPDITPAPVQPAQPSGNTPQGGDVNDKGEVYVPGFGWIPNSGPNQGGTSGSDGDWDKQIGSMG